MSRTRVLLADDHRMVAEGLRSILVEHFDLVGVVEDGAAMLAAVDALAPDVVVADISMPGLDGFEALSRLRQRRPGTKVVFLTMHAQVSYARRALELGAAGYVLKHAAPQELIVAVRAAIDGEVFLTPSIAAALNERPRGTVSRATSVTPRQREILELLAEGKSAKEIADVLSISTRTVEFHKYQLMDQWSLHNSAELVLHAVKLGIVRI